MERFVIARDSDIGIAVVGARAQARRLGFSPSQLDRLGTAVSELARNIVRYAQPHGGDILVHEQRIEGRLMLTVEARDNGPGIADIAQALRDHYSSSGSLGLGLPGVRRIMDSFAIRSIPGEGTVVTVALRQQP